MPKCRRCGAEIEYLWACEPVAGWNVWDFDIDGAGLPQYHEDTFESFTDSKESLGPKEFCCPECEKWLFSSEEEAIEFLKGGA